MTVNARNYTHSFGGMEHLKSLLSEIDGWLYSVSMQFICPIGVLGGSFVLSILV